MGVFSPIAIVGQGCLLPGCASPEALWQAVAEGACHVGPAPPYDWRIDHGRVLGAPDTSSGVDPVCTDMGGYVGSLDQGLDLAGVALDPALVATLDPVFRWSLHAAAQAMRGFTRKASDRAGVVLGNLSYPTRAHVRFAEEHWLAEAGIRTDAPVVPLNRFMSGAPAMLVAQAFGLSGGSLALDAACASGLYAIKVACDRLQDGHADLMLAGAVNAVDQLFLHTGFTALNALSPTGRSRPFHAEADGLIPAEGAAFVALKRVEDALAAGDRILGVIRGIGLSNDGRSGGFLSPAREGQTQAMRAALDAAGMAADEVQCVECHATGTLLGDATEIASLRGVYGDRPLVLGSLKGNVGHLITASGIAGLLKTLAAMEHGQMPCTPGARPLAAEIARAGYVVPDEPLDWPAIDGQRTAAINGFGFGGNNAQLIVQQTAEPERLPVKAAKAADDVVVVGMGVRTHRDADAIAFTDRLIGAGVADPAFDGDAIALPMRQIAFPPVELERALGQQLVLLDVCRQALAGVAPADRRRTGIFVGMETDSRVCLHGVRARWPELLAQGDRADPALIAAGDDFALPLDSAAVIGEMPNITANRLSNQLDLQGPGFAVSREELSGDAALDLAITALRRGEIDAALVGAVEMAREPVHAAAAAALLGETDMADAAVMLALKTRAGARAAGDPILAVLSEAGAGTETADLANDAADSPVNRLLGRAHAASGLLHVALGIGMIHIRAAPTPNGAASPLLGGVAPAVLVENRSFLGERAAWRIEPGTAAPRSIRPPVRIARYAAADRVSLLEALRHDRQGGDAPCRLALVGTADELAERRERALRTLAASPADAWSMDGITFRAAPLAGEMAFVFTGAASAYPGMGASLLLGMPGLIDRVRDRIGDPAAVAGAFFREGDAEARLPFRQLAGSSLLCQIHAALSLEILKLRPEASIGLSSGETNAMVAFGVWRDMDRLLADVAASGLYTEALAGRFDAVRTHWGLPAGTPVAWTNLRLRAPASAVEAEVARHPRAYLTIVNSPDDCVIGGDAGACRAVIDALGKPLAIPLGHDLAVHCAAVEPFAAAWREAHDRKTFAPTLPIRLYANAFGGVFEPTRRGVADALTDQALKTIDFPRIVDLAWRDGVRIFVEHGPRSSLATAIGEILGDRPHLAVSFDRTGIDGDVQAWRTVAALWCAGVEIDPAALKEASPSAVQPREPAPTLRFAVRKPHPIFPRVPKAQPTARRMPWPPMLAPVMAGDRGLAAAAPSSASIAPTVPDTWRPTAPEPTPPYGSAAAGAEASHHAALVSTHDRLLAAHRLHLDAQRAGMEAYLAAGQRLFAGLLGTAAPNAATPIAPPTLVPAPTATLRAPATIVPLPEPMPASSSAVPGRPGPQFNRKDLETLAGGRISSVFGPAFAGQDNHAVQVRMPQPPLLLCDRVLGIAGEPHSMGRGTIWTATDVHADSWYLHHGRMPPGIFIECGQADLLLISWLGIDELNRGERAYRLLGCELTFHGDLPQPGETLDYEIVIDGHARQGDVRLFFFHYECRIDGALRISVRNGQAGFFTPAELDGAGGVIWDPAGAAYVADAAFAPPSGATTRSAFTTGAVQSYLDGDLPACFGEGFVLARTHTRTPASPADHRNFLGEITALDFAGGPAGRGYLRVEKDIRGNEWFFDGHFKNDPCMPGTLMADACLQGMGFYMAAAGVTLTRDGWRFQPVRDTCYQFLCRGQVTPRSRRIVYEIFVDEFRHDEVPTLFAHILCTVDGRKAFLCERMGLQLVPDWPLGSMSHLIDAREDGRALARIGAFPLDQRSLIACALGRPSDAFGEGFAMFDAGKRTPRLPGPPYHFMTRITALVGAMGDMKAGGKVTVLYDVPPDAWYFADAPGGTMPICVLMEVALQPCGWLASYTLRQDRGPRDLLFRNLDGDGIQHREIRPDDGTIATSAELLSVDVMGDLIIEKFAVRCTVGDEEVFRCETVFGFFPPEAMRNQKGFAVTDDDLARLAAPSEIAIDLVDRSGALRETGAARLPDGRLLMSDRITGYWPDGGAEQLGAIRAEKDVRSSDWFFKAHFYQDPVQPGSLGVEAILQSIQALMLLGGMAEGFASPRFEPLTVGEQMPWHYRGQVTPERGTVVIEFEVTERRRRADAVTVRGKARLWVDGLQIYQLPRVGMRIVEDRAPSGSTRRLPGSIDLDGAKARRRDHCPASTLPLVPLTCESERIVVCDHAGQRLKLHPRWIRIEDGRCANLPLNRWSIAIEHEGDSICATSGDPEPIDCQVLHRHWLARANGQHTFVHDLMLAMVDRFVRYLVLADPQGFARLKGRPVLYLANHQNYVESSLFLTMMGALCDLPAAVIAKAEHRGTFVDYIYQLSRAAMGADDPLKLMMFDRRKPNELLGLLTRFGGDLAIHPRSLLVHTDGTRARRGGVPVASVSTVLIDLALEHDMPIVPVRFAGGLPLVEVAESQVLPVDLGRQDHYVGFAIAPASLRAMPFARRAAFVLAELNGLGPSGESDGPLPGDGTLSQSVARERRRGLAPLQATLRAVLAAYPARSDETNAWLASVDGAGMPAIVRGLIGLPSVPAPT
ncbi:beta-ketoacyl synthase N-terminal-like domain-containing protein [Methylobacterium sp. D54C]